MKSVYEVTTRSRRTMRGTNLANYTVIATDAKDAIKRAEKKFRYDGEYAAEVKRLADLDS